jgi:hypothetical protein
MNFCLKENKKSPNNNYPRYIYGRQGFISGIQRIINYYRNKRNKKK